MADEALLVVEVAAAEVAVTAAVPSVEVACRSKLERGLIQMGKNTHGSTSSA